MTPRARVVHELFRYFWRSGYARSAREDRDHKTHRGYEVRFGAHNREECLRILLLLDLAGFKAGTPFRKASHFRIPVYGRDQVRRLLELLGLPSELAAPSG